MNHDPVIVTDGLVRRFGEKTAVDGLTLEILRGEVFGLLGHNGAGKTTTVRLLNGVLTPHGGTAKVLGYSPIEDGPALRSKTGVLTETPSLYEQLSATENLRIFGDLYGVPRGELARRVDDILKMFNLADRAAEKVGGYSKGMKQRLALARAFLHDPELLFLDEPTAGLDPVAAKQVNDHITELSHVEGRTVVLATHNLYDAQRLCDRVAIIEHGHLVAVGTPTDLVHSIITSVHMEIEVAEGDVQQAQSVLQSMQETGDVQTDGSVVMLPDVKRDAIPVILLALLKDGVRVYRAAPHEPTLEDVYFALHRAEEKKQ